MAISDAGSELPEPEETTDSRAKQQSALAELSQLALQSGELLGLLENSIGLVAEILQLRFCEVLEFQPSENQFLLVAGLGWKPGNVGTTTIPVTPRVPGGIHLPDPAPGRDRGLYLRHAVRSFAAVGRTQDSQRHHRSHSRTRRALWSAGRLQFGDAAASRPDDINFMRSVANIIATAMQRKHDEEAVRRSEAIFSRSFGIRARRHGNCRQQKAASSLSTRRASGSSATSAPNWSANELKPSSPNVIVSTTPATAMISSPIRELVRWASDWSCSACARMARSFRWRSV